MANFTGGMIDLSENNEFDNVLLASGSTTQFSNAGTGGGSGVPIKVKGNFTMTGGDLYLRQGINIFPGSITIGGVTKDLNAGTRGYGRGGVGAYYYQSGGGSGGTNSAGNAGTTTGTGTCGIGGTFPGGNGGNGTPYNSSASGGGGGAGSNGASCEKVCFCVYGKITITGGAIYGTGSNGGTGGNGGAGASTGGSDSQTGGGGGGGGGAGGNGGKLIFIYGISYSESGLTKSLAGGSGGNGGACHNVAENISPSANGTAGTSTTGAVEYYQGTGLPAPLADTNASFLLNML